MNDTTTTTPEGTPMITLWLVEEHTTGYGGMGEEEIPFHTVVGAPDASTAFEIAGELAKLSRTSGGEPAGFMFAADELEEVTPGYLWAAEDGSSIFYEVRKLGAPILDTVPAVLGGQDQ